MFFALGIVLSSEQPSQRKFRSGPRRLTRASVPGAMVANTTGASSTLCCRTGKAEVPMPKVRNSKRAKDFCENGCRGRGQCPDTSRCWFALLLLVCLETYCFGDAAWFDRGVGFAVAICSGPCLTRASVPAAMVANTTGASSTLCCRSFQQA
jgi:hypothetical protein